MLPYFFKVCRVKCLILLHDMPSNSINILIVEDERSLSDTLSLNLKLEGYNVINAYDGNTALKLFNEHHHDLALVLLDIMLPGISGMNLITEFRVTDPKIPVIFMTAKGLSSEKIAGLRAGADDYIVKPFDLEELILRVQNLIKRTHHKKEIKDVYQFAHGSINFDTFEIKDQLGRSHTLSKKEIGLLHLLTSAENKVISRDEIIDQLWEPDENASSRTIDNYILAFRKYFEVNPKEPYHFLSIRGVGYKFVP